MGQRWVTHESDDPRWEAYAKDRGLPLPRALDAPVPVHPDAVAELPANNEQHSDEENNPHFQRNNLNLNGGSPIKEVSS